jgi:hypothetical protein
MTTSGVRRTRKRVGSSGAWTEKDDRIVGLLTEVGQPTTPLNIAKPWKIKEVIWALPRVVNLGPP